MDKDLLRAFGKASAMGAFPSYEAVDVPVTPDHWWNTYVAPKDGFFVGEAGTDTAVAGSALVELMASACSTSITVYGVSRATVPVRKGETVSFAIKGTYSLKAMFVYAKATATGGA